MAREAIIRKVNRYELHGVRYYQFFYSYADEPDRVREARLSHDVVYPDPADGDTVLIDAILNMVTSVQKKP